MASGDIQILYDGGHADLQSRRFKVHSGVAAGINPGELVLKQLGSGANAGGRYVTRWTQGVATKPRAGTDFVAGLSVNTSTDTTTANGVVDVIIPLPGMVFLANPNSSTAYDTQSEYDALVGARVLLDSSSTGVQTILATDAGNATQVGSTFYNLAGAWVGSGNGLVVEPLDIAKHPGKVAFSIKQSLVYNVL